MKKNILLELSQDFAVEVIAVARILAEKGEKGFADQIKRSGTSISANIAEGNHPQSRADMISKFEIALKEANETENWLNIFRKSELIQDDVYLPIKDSSVKGNFIASGLLCDASSMTAIFSRDSDSAITKTKNTNKER